MNFQASFHHGRTGFSSFAIVPAVLVCFLCSMAHAWGPPPPGMMVMVSPVQWQTSVTNRAPFVDSFESYANNMLLLNTNGWLFDEYNGISYVTNKTYSFQGAYPLPTEPHSKTLYVDGQVGNNVRGTNQHVWLDMMVKGGVLEDESLITIATNVQTAWFVTTSGLLKAKCGWTTGGVAQVTGWLEMNHAPLAAEAWARLTVHFAYKPDGANNYFSLYLNGQALEHPKGRFLPGSATTNGSWFLCSDQTLGYFPGVSFCGVGLVDDVVVTDACIGSTNDYSTAIRHAVQINWASDFGAKYQVEWCSSLEDPVWQSLGSFHYGNGTTNSVFDSTQGIGKRFYNVRKINL